MINIRLEPVGYEHPDYAFSLAEFGSPLCLDRTGAWILQRPISDSPYTDGMGMYPMFFCRDWAAVGQDLSQLPEQMISFSAVTEPFAGCDERVLKSVFDVVKPFKDHFITELKLRPDQIVSKSHRKHARRALRRVAVDVCQHAEDFIDEWQQLYALLVQRHQIRGIKAFSREAFAMQLRVPGLVMFRATEKATNEVLGFDLWYHQGDFAYDHLAAFNERGYSLLASYATKWCVLDHFREKTRFLDLGGVAGIGGNHHQGLAHFKRGWATGVKRNYFCGKILNLGAYAELTKAIAGTRCEDGSYFPAYRWNEFL